MGKTKKKTGQAARRSSSRPKRTPKHLDPYLVRRQQAQPDDQRPTTSNPDAVPMQGATDHISKLIEAGIATAVESIRRDLQVQTTGAAGLTAHHPSSHPITSAHTDTGPLSPASIIETSVERAARPAHSQTHQQQAYAVTQQQPAITATHTTDLVTADGVHHFLDQPTVGGAPHNNITANMAAPLLQRTGEKNVLRMPNRK
ncbi:uncharacterized protein [Ptychodera flava]|uniref:uncharacterized protein n=1 Tax=Ptychodera flava TaxID=63121 RepID=UPI00396A982D